MFQQGEGGREGGVLFFCGVYSCHWTFLNVLCSRHMERACMDWCRFGCVKMLQSQIQTSVDAV